MSNTAELCARLLEHAAIHDRETSPYSPEQAAWAADLRDAAALIQAAPVVERADSATAVVERRAGNMSDNAAPVAHARWYCVTNYGGATLCTSRADAAEVAAEQDIAVPGHGPHRAVMLAEVPPARVPLTDDPWHKLYRRAINEANGLTNYVEDRPELRSAERRLTAIEAEARTLAAAATPAQGEPK